MAKKPAPAPYTVADLVTDLAAILTKGNGSLWKIREAAVITAIATTLASTVQAAVQLALLLRR